ncbi:MAG: PorT family protein [Bacteroidetes bacterium]|nr:PorT family protein [Bacteroidota bacterium]
MRKPVAGIMFVCSCLLFQKVFSQNISVGVKGGISIPNLRSGGSNPVSSGYQSGLGPNFALFGEYGISNLFSLELGLEYSAQGGKKHGKQALTVTPDIAALFYPNPAPQYLWTNFDADAKFNYLMVPVLAKFGFDLGDHSPLRVYISAGPFASFLLSANTKTSGTSNVYADEAETIPLLTQPAAFDTTADIKDQLKSFNWGVEVNIGIVYSFDQHRIFLEGGGNYGFIPVQKHAEDGQNNAGAATIRIGYAYTFGSSGGRSGRAARGVKSPKVYN